jgi:hypothetical protein
LHLQHKKYYLRQYSYESYQHGGVGYSDAENILSREGFETIEFPLHQNFSLKAKVKRFLHLIKSAASIRNRSVVVFIFPLYARMHRLLVWWLRQKKVKLICLIADIDGLKDGNEALLRKEIKYLNGFRYFIVHNDTMKSWLNQNVYDPGIAILEFFDFLTEPVDRPREPSLEIAFAGNLAKSGFLKNLECLPALHFHLYGRDQTEAFARQRNVSWHGAAAPHQLPALLKGAYGLVWDGDLIDRPGGSLGHYMHYISHHKLSLYILAGMPLIVPSFAGSAELVKRYGIGISVESLLEIPERIAQISREEYHSFRNNMKQLAERISRGNGLKSALEQLIKEMEN